MVQVFMKVGPGVMGGWLSSLEIRITLLSFMLDSHEALPNFLKRELRGFARVKHKRENGYIILVLNETSYPPTTPEAWPIF